MQQTQQATGQVHPQTSLWKAGHARTALHSDDTHSHPMQQHQNVHASPQSKLQNGFTGHRQSGAGRQNTTTDNSRTAGGFQVPGQHENAAHFQSEEGIEPGVLQELQDEQHRMRSRFGDVTDQGVVPVLLQELQSEQNRMRTKFQEHMEAMSQIEREAVSAREQQELARQELQRVHEMLSASAATRNDCKPSVSSAVLNMPVKVPLDLDRETTPPYKAVSTNDEAPDLFVSVQTHLLPPGMCLIPDDPAEVNLPEHALQALRASLLPSVSSPDFKGEAELPAFKNKQTSGQPSRSTLIPRRCRA